MKNNLRALNSQFKLQSENKKNFMMTLKESISCRFRTDVDEKSAHKFNVTGLKCKLNSYSCQVCYVKVNMPLEKQRS